MFKLNFKFTKKGFTKYISHLDLMRLLSRAMRRAGLALKFSEGYSPHVKLSLKRALKLGLESEEEEGKIALREWIRPEEFAEKLQKQLPGGIVIKQVTWELRQ